MSLDACISVVLVTASIGQRIKNVQRQKDMRNAVYIIAMVFAWSFLGWYMQSCKSTGPGVDRTILEHQRQVTELEARNQALERRIAQYDSAIGSAVTSLEDIRARSVGMEGTVDELIDLFDQYQRGVEQLARAYNDIKNQTGSSN
jgi:cell division protein FtsB